MPAKLLQEKVFLYKNNQTMNTNLRFLNYYILFHVLRLLYQKITISLITLYSHIEKAQKTYIKF